MLAGILAKQYESYRGRVRLLDTLTPFTVLMEATLSMVIPYPATASHALNNSATLHACAKQPAGANGASGSATSQIEPTQSSQRCLTSGCNRGSSLMQSL